MSIRTFTGRALLSASLFCTGLFSMVATFDLLNSSPSFFILMAGFIMAPLELMVPYFLLGFVLLGALSVSVAWGKRKLSVAFFILYLAAFWFYFFSHIPTGSATVDYSASWFINYVSGYIEDMEGFIAFAIGVLLFGISRLVSTMNVSKSLIQALIFGSGTLASFTAAMHLLTHFGSVHVTNFQSDFLGSGLNINFITNDFVLALTSMILASYFVATYFARRGVFKWAS